MLTTLLIGLGIVLFAIAFDQSTKWLMVYLLQDLPNQTI